MRRRLAGPLALLVLAACQPDLLTNEAPTDDPLASSSIAAAVAGTAEECLTCTFEPRLYTRSRGVPATDAIEFPGDPAGAYVLLVDELGTRGANSSVVLNGERLKLGSGEPVDVVLEHANTMHVRLTGKPGSQLLVKVYQEIASVEVTPATARGRIPARQQFTAVALDRNGVAIPRQTFTWRTAQSDIVSIFPSSGLAQTLGSRHDSNAFAYFTTSLGDGVARLVAAADGAPEHEGEGVWTIVQGFVFTTWNPPRRLDDPRRASRPHPLPYAYDVPRLGAMARACHAESRSENDAWADLPTPGLQERFRQCYDWLETANPMRQWIPATPISDGFYQDAGVKENVGLYGRYCGGGHPDPWWHTHATGGNYQALDPVDAICMQHDRAGAEHDEGPATPHGTCIVQYGMRTSTLHEEGVLVPEGSDRWNVFWSQWPRMKESRDHWLWNTGLSCSGPFYDEFLENRGL